MSGRIDHEAHAIEALRSIPRDVPPELAVQVAQAAATLALVEQQRIANLIALVEQGSDAFEEALPVLRDEAAAALMQFVQTGGTQISGPDEFPEVRPEIREALGL